VENQSEPVAPVSPSGGSAPAGSKPASPNHGPSRLSLSLTAVSIGLLAVLVWYLNPRPPKFRPAPLEPISRVCPQLRQTFVPSNLIDIPAPILKTVPDDVRKRIVLRVNREMCPCGCKLSIASCLMENPSCEAGARRFKEIVDEEKEKAAKTGASK